jgi:integrase
MVALNKLTAAKVKSKAPGKFSDGGGLWLHRRKDGGGQWFLRFTLHGVRHEMGLGSVRTDDTGSGFTLAGVRSKAEACRALVRDGKNPIKEREKSKQAAITNLHCLRDVAIDAFESRKAELRDDGKAGRWFSPLELYVLPRLGKTPVAEIDQRDIRDTLAPIWHTKADTALKAMNRLNITIKHAAALGLDVDIQAVDKAKALLGRQRHTVKNIPSLNWREVPEFYLSLSDGGVTHLALRLLILTAMRSKPIRFAHVDQFEGNVWTVPASLMKGRLGKVSEFRVPLSKDATQVVADAIKISRDGFLFPSVRKGVISDATMSRMMERRKMIARPHGFRASFRTWCAEATDTPKELAETALGHVIGNEVERAYRRTDLLERRAVLMQKWADHASGKRGSVTRLVAQ